MAFSSDYDYDDDDDVAVVVVVDGKEKMILCSNVWDWRSCSENGKIDWFRGFGDLFCLVCLLPHIML